MGNHIVDYDYDDPHLQGSITTCNNQPTIPTALERSCCSSSASHPSACHARDAEDSLAAWQSSRKTAASKTSNDLRGANMAVDQNLGCPGTNVHGHPPHGNPTRLRMYTPTNGWWDGIIGFEWIWPIKSGMLSLKHQVPKLDTVLASLHTPTLSFLAQMQLVE